MDSLFVVPVEARPLAQSWMEAYWKDIVRDDPAFFGFVAGVDVTNATLGEPFFVFKLADGGLDKYLNSADNDPRRFAAVVHYHFPIELSDHSRGGGVIIARNRDDMGRKFSPDDGEVMLGGVDGLWDPLPATIGALRSEYSNPCQVDYVDLGEQRFLVTDRLGNLLSGKDPSSLKPIAEDAATIRERIRVIREAFPAPDKK